MKKWQDKVSRELGDLTVKIGKLESFMESEAYGNLSLDQRDLLDQQIVIMSDYADVLKERLRLDG